MSNKRVELAANIFIGIMVLIIFCPWILILTDGLCLLLLGHQIFPIDWHDSWPEALVWPICWIVGIAWLVFKD